jgi:hypothetical protein
MKNNRTIDLSIPMIILCCILFWGGKYSGHLAGYQKGYKEGQLETTQECNKILQRNIELLKIQEDE